MLDFLNTKIEFFGLHFSDYNIRVAKIEKSKKEPVLASLGKGRLEEGVIKEGRVRDETSLSLAIKRITGNIEGERLGTKYIAASLPEEKSFLQVIEMPKMSREELRKAALYEAENCIPLPIEDVYLDFQVIPGEKKGHLDILVASLPKKIVDPYVSSIEKAGFSPAVLEIESVSIARAIIEREEFLEPTLIVDIGENKTNFIISSRGAIQFSSFNSMSSESFTKEISKERDISLSGAEALKVKYGIEGKEGERNLSILNSLSGKLKEEIEKYLAYYDSSSFLLPSKEKKEGIRRIIVCNDGASLKGLDSFLSKELGIEVKTGNPFSNFSKGLLDISEKEAQNYVAAFGLALRNFEER